MIAFTYGEGGRIGDIVDIFSALRQPSIPITPTITKLRRGIASGLSIAHSTERMPSRPADIAGTMAAMDARNRGGSSAPVDGREIELEFLRSEVYFGISIHISKG
jgi:hypothetical protein